MSYSDNDRRCDLRRFVATLLIVGLGFSAEVHGQTAYPMIMSLSPVAAQTGATSLHTVNSRYDLTGAYQIMISGSGVRGEIVAEPNSKTAKKTNIALKIKLTVAKDAMPGVRDFRIATPRGVSTVGQLVVVGAPVVRETKDNNVPTSATPTTVPATLCGALEKSEDVDVFRFRAEAHTPLYFHMRAMRLQDRIHDLQQHVDPILTVRNSRGVTLATSDNFFFADPLVGIVVPKTDDYFLEVRDVRYQGNRYWEYCIEAGDGPFVTTTFPLAVAHKQAADIELVGMHVNDQVVKSQPVTDLGVQLIQLPIGQSRSNEVPIWGTDVDTANEPRDADNQALERALPVATVGIINGRISVPNSADYFRFHAEKGQKLSFEVHARRLGSQLDSHLRVLDAKGKPLKINDDQRFGKRSSSDSLIENWSAPSAGDYFVEIRDLHLRGGAGYVYALQIKEAKPTFSLFADTDKTPIFSGTSGVVFVRAERKNGFQGEIQLGIEDLPVGVKATCGRILAGGQDGCITLWSASGTKPSVANVRIFGTAKENDTVIRREATVYQETYQPGGGRGHWPVDNHTVSVGNPGDVIQVETDIKDITLKPGESKEIQVRLTRAKGFSKNVLLEVVYKHLNSTYGNPLPAGVSVDASTSKTLLTNGATVGKIVLKADSKAKPVERQTIVIMANVSLNFVMKTTYASAPLTISVK